MAEELQTQSLTRVLVASSVAGMLTRIPCHPIDTLKAQMQASSGKLGLYGAFKQTIQSSGVRGLYAGFGTAFVGSGPASMQYLTSFEAFKPMFRDAGMFQDSLSGFSAEVLSCLLWVPIDVIKERLQVQRLAPVELQYKGNWDAVKTVVRQEGSRGLYRGYGATLGSYGPFSAIYLGTYDPIKQICAAYLPSSISLLTAGAVSGAFASWITNPLDLVKVRLQIQRRGKDTFGYQYKHMLDGLRQVYRETGILGLYKGAFARVLFAAPSAAITMALFDTLKTVQL